MGSVALIGHRIAHGGDLFSESTLITEEVMAQIRQSPRWRRCITTPT